MIEVIVMWNLLAAFCGIILGLIYRGQDSEDGPIIPRTFRGWAELGLCLIIFAPPMFLLP